MYLLSSLRNKIFQIQKEQTDFNNKNGLNSGVGWRDGEKRHTTVIE